MRETWRWWRVWVVWVCAIGMLLNAQEKAKTEVEDPQHWTWKDRDGKVRTRAELDGILAAHRLWLNTEHKQGSRANLSKADLSGANLYDAPMREADLSGANLTKAEFLFAHLNGADFSEAVLSGADLNSSHVDRAVLRATELGGAHISGMTLLNAIYEPKTPPPVDSIAYAEGLGWLRYRHDPSQLVALRKAFQDAGFIQQRREITAALHRSKLELDRRDIRRRHLQQCLSLEIASVGGIENLKGIVIRRKLDDHGSLACRMLLVPPSAEWLLFDWTCAWGADWSHPLVLLGWLCLVCGPVYWVGMHFGRVGGIYQIVLNEVVATKAAKEVVSRVDVGVKYVGWERWRGRRAGLRWRLVAMALRAEWRALRLAFLFSVLSALDIGFHEFNVGQWARMLLARDFNLKARGWMRVAGGVQSLVGLGLVALSLLSYFGHPFD